MEDAGCGGERKLKKERCALLARPYPGLCFLPSFPTGASPLDLEVGGGVGEESETRWLPNTVPGSYPALPGRNFSPNPNKWGSETQSCGKGKLLAPLGLGCSCLLLNVSSPCHLFTFSCL